LSYDAINSDFLKGLVDSGTKLIEVLDFIIDKVGLLKTALIAIGTIWGSQKLGYCVSSRLRYHPAPRLKPVGKTQRPSFRQTTVSRNGVGCTSKIKRCGISHSRTADMTAWSYAA